MQINPSTAGDILLNECIACADASSLYLIQEPPSESTRLHALINWIDAMANRLSLI